jgi:hypothetical protein
LISVKNNKTKKEDVKMRTLKVFSMAMALFLIIGLAAQTAMALPTNLILGIDDDSDQFVLFDIETYEETTLSITSGAVNGKVPNEIESLTFDYDIYNASGSDVFYGVQSYDWKDTSQLYKFELSDDLSSISIETVGDAFTASEIEDMEYIDGSLYAVDNSTNDLVTINTDGELIARTAIDGDEHAQGFEGLAYSFEDGKLYGSATYDDKGTEGDGSSSLYAIDIGTGQTDYVGKIGFGEIEAMTFASNTLYGASDMSDDFIQINTATGKGIKLADWGSDIEGMAGGAAPEPATMFLLGAGLLGLACFRKKFKK